MQVCGETITPLRNYCLPMGSQPALRGSGKDSALCGTVVDGTQPAKSDGKCLRNWGSSRGGNSRMSVRSSCVGSTAAPHMLDSGNDQPGARMQPGGRSNRHDCGLEMSAVNVAICQQSPDKEKPHDESPRKDRHCSPGGWHRGRRWVAPVDGAVGGTGKFSTGKFTGAIIPVFASAR